jgi:hypothetical protein
VATKAKGANRQPALISAIQLPRELSRKQPLVHLDQHLSVYRGRFLSGSFQVSCGGCTSSHVGGVRTGGFR